MGSARTFVVGCLMACGVAAIGQTYEYPPLSAEVRLRWFLKSTLGPTAIAGSAVVAGWGTGFDHPKEYDTHWDGFGERYGLHVSQSATSNAMEAGIGAFWGEDPRYFPDTGQPFCTRLGHVIKYTFFTKNRDGQTVPAFARYAAISGSNFISNAWRPPSEATANDAAERIGLGFAGRMASNALHEFMPDLMRRFSHKQNDQ
jgi:hypothetical protein